MAKTPFPSLHSENRILALLPPTEYQRLAPLLQAVPLQLKKILYHAYATIDYVYFPSRGVVSTMTIMEDGSAIEVATIGNEGVVGASTFLGGETSPNEVMVQVEGHGVRIRAEVLKAEARQEGPLQRVLSLYQSALQTQISFSVACNGLHKIEKRCCRIRGAAVDARISGDHAGSAAFECDGCAPAPAGARADRRRPRRDHHQGPARPGGACLRMLPEQPGRISALARVRCGAIARPPFRFGAP
jgi:hypothetical protein